MSEEYKVHNVWLSEINFEILVLEIPKADIEDKLAYLAREKGNVTKSLFEDFVITHCIANVNQVLYNIRRQEISDIDVLITIRQKIMDKILEINPVLNPENLVINRNSVIKIKTDDTDDSLLPLTKNKNWDLSYDDIIKTEDDFIDVEHKEVDKSNLPVTKDVNNLEYSVVKQWWKRINKYIEVKKFNKEDIPSVLSQRYFHNRSSFQTFIVSTCVVGAEDLFILLDDMGLPNRVAPPILMNEVYELCRDANPFLTYENAQELTDIDDTTDEEPKYNGNRPNNRMASQARQSKTKKKKQKLFKDIAKEDLLKLSDAIKVFVIGQDEAITNVVEAVQRAAVGLKEPGRPIGSFLFAGRTGCGKTLTTKVLADELIKSRDNLVTIDCSEYSADHEYSKLIGAPSGYIGHEAGGMLTNAVLENPFSVVVFDEFEKASHRVHELLLQILEEGRLTDGKGQKVSFKDCVVIMTSNIGVKEVDDVKKTIGFGDVAELTEEKKNKAIDVALKKKFKPEFLNRVDSIVHFGSLTEEDYMRIIDLELYKLNENLKTNDTEFKNLTLNFNKKVKNFIYKHGINEDFGARPLKRCIEQEISTPLATRLLFGDVNNEATVNVTVLKGKISFKIVNPKSTTKKAKTKTAAK